VALDAGVQTAHKRSVRVAFKVGRYRGEKHREPEDSPVEAQPEAPEAASPPS
jgi:hypothetical protein